MRIRLRSPRRDDDAGFLLLETIVAIVIITIVMGGLTALLITVNSASSRQRDEQSASRLAVSALDHIRAIGAAGAVSGRDATSAAAQLEHTPASADFPATLPTVAPWLAGMATAADSSAGAGAGASATLPTLATHQVVNGHTFSLSYFVGYCWRAAASASGAGGTADCVASDTAGAIQFVRVVVAVAWPGACSTSVCDYVSASLLDGSGDPVFDFNQTPPPAPEPDVPAQSNTVGDDVQGVSGVAGCAAPCAFPVTNGVPPMSFVVTGLPPGLQADASGVVTGQPTRKGSYPVSVTVTDAFLATGSTSFTWSIGTPLSFTNPGAQTTTAGAAVSLQVRDAAGGSGGGYSWSASGLPPGLSIDGGSGLIAGRIGATAGGPNPYPVTVTLSQGGSSVTHSFAWTVNRKPLSVTGPPNQRSEAGVPIDPLDLAGYLDGGSGSATWSDPGGSLPAGLAISGDGQTITGTPAAAAAGKAVTLQVHDTVTDETVSATFTWTVSAPPTLRYDNQYDYYSRRGGWYSTRPDSYTCPGGGCAFSVSATRYGSPASGVSVGSDGTVWIEDPSRATYTITVTVTDDAGASASDTFTWRFS